MKKKIQHENSIYDLNLIYSLEISFIYKYKRFFLFPTYMYNTYTDSTHRNPAESHVIL